jgi:hypothetical protein
VPIYDQTFRRYEGARSTRALWWPIARMTFKPALKNKLTWVLLVGMLLGLVALSIGFFAAAKVEELAPGQANEAMRTARMQKIPLFGRDVNLGTLFHVCLGPVFPLMGLLLLATGGGSISSDLRNSALPLYFSRPLRPWQYLFGKILGLTILPFSALSISLLIVFVQFVAYFRTTRDLITDLPVFLAALLQVLLISLMLAIAMAAFSSATKNARTAGVLFFGFFIATTAFGVALAGTTRMPELRVLAPRFALQTVSRALLHPNFSQFGDNIDVTGIRLKFALCALVFYTTCFLVLLRRNLRVVEVVK